MNAFTVPSDPNRLVTLLTEQRDLYQQLRTLSDRQRTLISSNQPDTLLELLTRRRQIVAALAELNERLGPYRRHWDEMYTALPETHRAQASGLLQEVNGLLRVILKTDQEDGALLAARKQAVGSEIRGLTDGRTANAAYAAQVAPAHSTASSPLSG
jgi:flagellar biosynthesis/type III secretory pathway chaperone